MARLLLGDPYSSAIRTNSLYLASVAQACKNIFSGGSQSQVSINGTVSKSILSS